MVDNPYLKYVNELCKLCNKKGNCNIVVFSCGGIEYTKCNDYVQEEGIELCMKTHCKECRKYGKCFGGGSNA